MSASEVYFQTSQSASNYKKYRSETPQEIIQKILEFLGKQFKLQECVAVDVGCGSGQSSLPLAPHLLKIIGVDISTAQLAEIKSDPRGINVEFRVGEAEDLPVDDKSVHLVIVMHAVHWFDYSAFIKEVDRVLIPGGVLAIGDSTAGYSVLGYEEEAKKLFDEMFKQHIAPLMPYNFERKDKFYETLQLPYEEFIRKRMPIKFPVTVDFLIGRLKTVSGVGKFLDEHPKECQEFIKQLEEKIMNLLGATGTPEETEITYIKTYILILCRKPLIN